MTFEPCFLKRRGAILAVSARNGKCYKTPFKSPAKAKKFLRQTSKPRARESRRIYRCKYCDSWHLTTNAV